MESLAAVCALSPEAGRERLEQWCAFDADYALESTRGSGVMTVTYAKNPDSFDRLNALVDAERVCCAALDWSIEERARHLVLIVRGTPLDIASLRLG